MTESTLPRRLTYPLTGLHCGACIKRVTDALLPLAKDVVVTLSPMQVTLNAGDERFELLQAAVAAAGKYSLNTPSQPAITSGSLNADLPMQNQLLGTNSAILEEKSWLGTYYPLLLIIGLLCVASVLAQIGSARTAGLGFEVLTPSETMRYFMAGFFIVFAFFKLLDINGFANAYAGYDLLAARWRGWGLIYPFIELGLGLAFLANWQMQFMLWLTIGVMGFSALGVIRAVTSGRKIQCACLGAVFKLPMSTVTIVEDIGMVVMAALML